MTLIPNPRFRRIDTRLEAQTHVNRVKMALVDVEKGPPSSDLELAPQIDFWRPVLVASTVPCLFGFVTGHPRLGIGPTRTSWLIGIDANAGWARTLSRFYRLGVPFSDLACEVKQGVLTNEDADRIAPTCMFRWPIGWMTLQISNGSSGVTLTP